MVVNMTEQECPSRSMGSCWSLAVRGRRVGRAARRNQRVVPAPTGALDAERCGGVAVEVLMRCSCAVCQTLHGAGCGWRRVEHAEQRPRRSGA